MALVAPVELVTPLIVLVGGGVDPQRTVWVGLGMILRLELILGKGFGIVLFRICSHRCRVQADERGIHNTEFIESLYQVGHDLL